MKKISDEVAGSLFSQIKNILILVVIILVLIIGVVLFFKISGISIPNPFKSQPIVIDKTTNVVEEVHRLAELTTATYYEDYVIVKKRTRESTVLGLKINDVDDELVLITKGKVRAGFDLSKLQPQDILLDSISITLKLPEVRLLDIITNPSDFETFEESGDWSYEEVTKYKNEARAAIEQSALESGILELAEKTGKERLTSFLQVLGFKEVTILNTKNFNAGYEPVKE
jgi:hypothetical protein